MITCYLFYKGQSYKQCTRWDGGEGGGGRGDGGGGGRFRSGSFLSEVRTGSNVFFVLLII